jgi:hypothetical protein
MLDAEREVLFVRAPVEAIKGVKGGRSEAAFVRRPS